MLAGVFLTVLFFAAPPPPIPHAALEQRLTRLMFPEWNRGIRQKRSENVRCLKNVTAKIVSMPHRQTGFHMCHLMSAIADKTLPAEQMSAQLTTKARTMPRPGGSAVYAGR